MPKEETVPIQSSTSSKSGVRAAAVLAVMLIAGAFFTLARVSPEIPLQYSRPWGADQLAPKSSLLVLAASGIAVLLLHPFLASLLFGKDRLSAQLVIWMSVFLLFLCVLSVLTVYSRVGPQT